MKVYSPGASIHSDYYHYCDCCEIDDDRPVLWWKENDFTLCYECLKKLFIKYIQPSLKIKEHIEVIRKRISEELRDEILTRDNYQCVLCNSKKQLELDHIIPFIIGGKTIKENLRTLCKKCNLKRRRNDEVYPY